MNLINLDLPDTVTTNTWDGTPLLTIKTETGRPKNLNGCLIEMKVRLSFDSPSVLYFSTTDETINIVEPPTLGQFFVEPSIIDVPPGSYQYDIKITYPSGEVYTHYAGNWNIIPCITR